MGQWAQILVSGFSLGSFYAVVALGFSLIFGVTHAFNLAHGELIVLSGYLAYILWKIYDVPFLLTLPVCLLVMPALTLPLQFLLRRLMDAGHEVLSVRPHRVSLEDLFVSHALGESAGSPLSESSAKQSKSPPEQHAADAPSSAESTPNREDKSS